MENQYYNPVPEENNNKKKKGSAIVPILAIITVACVLFSAVQTFYIFKLTTGTVGNLTYTRSANDNDEDENTSSEAEEDADTEADTLEVAEPHFNLEEAASVTDPDKETLSTTEIVELVSPATVSVYITGEYNGEEDVLVSGTGFIISADGYIVTNEHVVESAVDEDSYTVYIDVPGYEDLIEAEIIGTDEQTDIAVLKLTEGSDYPYVTLGDSDTLQVGEMVVAIGNPLGKLEGTVTVGVVSALDREISSDGYNMTYIQTDASINSGNSGGPLINSFGEVIGVTNAKISSAEGLGFAIPISDVKDVIESLINYGYVANRPYLGISVGYMVSNSYYGAVEGVYCAEVVEGGPADEAGIQAGDRIVSIDGVEIESTGDIIDIRDSHEVGDTIKVTVERNGREIDLELKIGDSGSTNETK